MTGSLHQEEAIRLPSSLSASDPTPLFRICRQISDSSENTVIDASELRFIDPFGLAVLRATLELQPDGKEINIRWMQQNLINYLARMEFFQGLNVEGVDVESARNPAGEPHSCVELLRITETDQSEVIASRLVQAMTGQDASNDAELEPYRRPIEYALKELLENALSHARREGNAGSGAWVACQHFQEGDTVRLSIVDNGCGFLATLAGHRQLLEATDASAIKTALIERVSCNRGPLTAYETDSQNQGVGLTMTARIADRADGCLVVASGNAWLRTVCNAEGSLEGSEWKGVAIAFECSRRRLPEIDIASLLPEVEEVMDAQINFE